MNIMSNDEQRNHYLISKHLLHNFDIFGASFTVNCIFPLNYFLCKRSWRLRTSNCHFCTCYFIVVAYFFA